MALGLLAIPVVVLSDWVQIGDQDWDLAWAIALMAIGFVLLKDDERDERTKAPRPTTATALASPAVEAAVPRRRKPRSPLTFMTLGAAFVACAIASMFTASGAVSLDAGQFVALAVMVVGLGLVVGGWWGRARFLVVIAMFLLPVMVVASMVDAPLRGDVGGGYVSVGRENPDEYSLLVGTMTLDYSNYRFEEGETAKVDVTFFAGDFEIYVPPGVDVVVRGEMDIGTADLFGAGFDGRNMSFDNESFDRKGLTKGSLIVNVDGGLGSFDLTWARWVEQQKRFDLRQEERKEHKARRDERGQESDARKGAKKDGRRKDSN